MWERDLRLLLYNLSLILTLSSSSLMGADPKPKLYQRLYDRICRTNRINLQNTAGISRTITARFVKDYPVENNDWGDFQTHRRLLGIISVSKCTSQIELNEACRVHESLKAKYVNTLYDSRCIIFGVNKELKMVHSNGVVGDKFSTPSNFKSTAYFYPDYEACHDLEVCVNDFVSTLFWILESKREEKNREKIDKVSLLLAPFEKKDFIGLDLESRANRKRCVGRMTKHLGDLSLQCGLFQEALNFYQSATDTLRSVNDWLWLGGSLEGQAAVSAILLYPHLSRTYLFQRNSSLQDAGATKNKSLANTANPLPVGTQLAKLSSCLAVTDIPRYYREAILHYSKYQNAGIIETEACFKCARISIEQGATLNAATVLQNVVFINLQLSEHEKIVRFTTLAELYRQIGFMRKAAFCSRLAATRFVSLQNPTPDWNQCYTHMLQSFGGHKLSLDPTDFPQDCLIGWASLQVQLLQELVVAARRMDHPALATRHMTFLIQTLWPQLSQKDQREFALQLQGLSSQCEGSPVALVLDSGLVIPPANLTNIPLAKSFQITNMPSDLRPQKLHKKEDYGPFLFTPIVNFGSLDRRNHKNDKVDYLWVEGDLCEVSIKLWNPLDFELLVSDVRLLTTGVVFESIPTSINIPPDTVCECVLTGIPKEVGDLEVLGYSTHTLGVKSNCKLKYIRGLESPQYSVEVIPAMARVHLSTSSPSRINPVNPFGDPMHVAANASYSLFAGERTECNLTVVNSCAVPLEFIEVSMKSVMDAELQGKTFQWNYEDITAQLPIGPGESAVFTICIYAMSPFLVPTNEEESVVGGSQPQSLVGSGPISLPSHISSPTSSRLKDVQSFRSGSTRSGGSMRLPASPVFRMNYPCSIKHIEGQLKIRYSGGPGLEAGYCRMCAVHFTLETLPSIHITGWDVLPAETSLNFYLVLDIANMTNQELEIEYTSEKRILMEANEPCRIPIPLPRCSLEKFPNINDQMSLEAELEMERVCSEHIASLVDLRWKIPASGRSGQASLSGISLAPDMLHIVMVSPLQWDITIDGEPFTVQEAVTKTAGEFFTLGVRVHNLTDHPLRSVALMMNCYQDYRNGTCNHLMDTRFAYSGPDNTIIDLIEEKKSAYQEYQLVFFHSGQFKIGMTCTTSDNMPIVTADAFNGIGNTWRLIPAIDIAITD